jgi:hypothetical protein
MRPTQAGHLCFRSCVLLLLFCALPFVVSAQYQVYYWSNFEDGQFPPGTTPLGKDFKSAVHVMDYSQIQGVPREFRAGIAASETGRHGLMIRADPAQHITGLGVGLILDRDRLGAEGRALYQADFFIPAADMTLPNVAVLAMEPPEPGKNTPKAFYRFGIALNRALYFSTMVQTEAEARLYVQDRSYLEKITRPGWHRFAIVFRGPTTIHCYIDGIEMPFSPIEEPTFRKLQVGIMVADKEKAYDCFVDNLSIQWATEDAPLPDSPYAEGWVPKIGNPAQVASGPADAAPSTAATGTASPGAPKATAAEEPILWYDPATGYEKATAAKKPLMVCFYAPRIPATQTLSQIFDTHPSAQAFLRQHVLAQIDINQLQGGELAKRFLVFKVPTIIQIGPDGQEKARATFARDDTWETFHAKLQAKPAP